MKALIDVTPTAEQLALFSRTSPGVEVIRGAAGSGKTTTALLKLRSVVAFYLNRTKRLPVPKPINVLVLTYNRTLRGYISELTQQQLQAEPLINVEISTFNRWAKNLLQPTQTIMNIEATSCVLSHLGETMKMDSQFIADESTYVLGRFLPENIEEYLSARRDGRVIPPFLNEVRSRGLSC